MNEWYEWVIINVHWLIQLNKLLKDKSTFAAIVKLHVFIIYHSSMCPRIVMLTVFILMPSVSTPTSTNEWKYYPERLISTAIIENNKNWLHYSDDHSNTCTINFISRDYLQLFLKWIPKLGIVLHVLLNFLICNLKFLIRIIQPN